MKIENITFKKLKPPLFPLRVYRQEHYNMLLKSLKKYDYIGGIVVNLKSNRIVDGLVRVHLLQKEFNLGGITAQVVELNDTEEAILRLNLNLELTEIDQLLLTHASQKYDFVKNEKNTTLNQDLVALLSGNWIEKFSIKNESEENVLFD